MARLFAVLLVAFALTGCLTQTSGPNSQLASLSTWQLRGKMGIRSDAGNANLSFVWNESPGRYDISLKGTLGVAIATVTGTGNQVVLNLPDGSIYRSNRVENLIEDHVGFRLPVSLLRYWVRGLPDPGYEVHPREQGFLQQGWQVEFQQFSTAGPRKILIEQDDIRLKLAALEWVY